MGSMTLHMRRDIPGNEPSRRGVLLLVVLSMLTLFVLLGSTYLVVAMRARKVATAFANKVAGAASAGPSGERFVDNAMLTVLRGTTVSNPTIPTPLNTGDDLLGDRYGGNTISGEIAPGPGGVAAYVSSEGFLEISTINLNPVPAPLTELAGRIVTIQLPALTASTRILRATGSPSAPQLVIAAGPTVKGPSLSLLLVRDALSRATSPGARRLVINGREFDDSGTNEPWDAFDGENPLLTRLLPSPAGIAAPTVTAAPFLGAPFLATAAPLSLTVDNDSDGVLDSAFVDVGLAAFSDSTGAVVQPKAAVLVIDLDGRVNFNTHGDIAAFETFDPSLGDSAYPVSFNPADNTYSCARPDPNDPNPSIAPVRSIPRGTGSVAGVSVIKAGLLRTAKEIPAAEDSTTGELLDLAGPLLGGLHSELNSSPSSRVDAAATTRSVPNVGRLEGRYGGEGWEGPSTLSNPDELPRPGQRQFNDPFNETRERWTVELHSSVDQTQQIALSYFDHPGRYGTPPDLKGRMQVWADPATGQFVYYKPYWDETARGVYDNEVVDDPYEIDLTPNGSRIATTRNLGTGGLAVNNPYTAADLEGLLRFYDPDSPQLSRRLVAINDVVASLNRLTVTTESWDTTAIVGDAWRRVVHDPFQSLLNTPTSVNDFFAPETIMGHRLDLNRPFHNTDVTEPNDVNGRQLRESMARHLYCLLVAIGTENNLGSPLLATDARRLAQYAVNIVDFRDADSVMTLFRYDPGFTPGSTAWNPGANDLVWGCERPEVIITETYSWHDRNTDDESVGGSVRMSPADPSFDQKRRPRCAFFVELTSPWGSPAYEYSPAAQTIRPLADPPGSANPADALRADLLDAGLAPSEDTNANGKLDSGEDRNGNRQIDPIRNRLDTAVDLQKRVGGVGDPVWRLISVRGNVRGGTAFGVDDVSEAIVNPRDSIIDPSRPGSPATIDRVFYFCSPSTTNPLSPALLNEVPGGVFWQAAAAGSSIKLPNFSVFGTDAPFSPGTGGAPPGVATMVGQGGKPATLTEPLVETNSDPYDAIMKHGDAANTMTPDPAFPKIAGFWRTPINQPLDATATPAVLIPQDPATNEPIAQGQPFIDAIHNIHLLMINGTHDNFAVVHLQRLADPNRDWENTVGSADYNPYVTVDSMPVDLNVFNTVGTKAQDDPLVGALPLPAGKYDDFSGAHFRMYGRVADQKLSTERGGRSPGGGNIADIWSRRVTAGVTDLRDATAFKTSTVATDPQPTPDPSSPFPVPCVLPAMPHHTLTTAPTDWDSSQPYASLFWPNRPFENSVEVTFVPAASPFHLTQRHSIDNSSILNEQKFFHLAGFWEEDPPASPWSWELITGRSAAPNPTSLLDFVHVRSRFAGLFPSVPSGVLNSAALADLGLDVYPEEQLSSWREPGRINVNTIVDGAGLGGEPRGAWRALFGGGDASDDIDANPAGAELPSWAPEVFGPSSAKPAQGETSPEPHPARQLTEIFKAIPTASEENGQPPERRDRKGGLLDERINPTTDILCQTDRHARFRYQTMLNLSDRVTTRSNVYAIWVTVGYFDVTGAEINPVQRNRGFFIVDRSIPVAYERGQDHNVRDAILLRRIIQ